MELKKTIAALVQVGQIFGEHNNIALKEVMALAYAKNRWFTDDSLQLALNYWHKSLTYDNLTLWAEKEQIPANATPKTIGIVAAGNIPLVCLHDILCVLLTGNKAMVKLSTDDEPLVKFFIQQLIQAAPFLEPYIYIAEKIEHPDAVIATGSNNTARYFQYYFGKYPHIIRKNRNSIAVLAGTESAETLLKIGNDIFNYFGKGCRNVTQVWAPQGYDWVVFMDALQNFASLINHNKYANNYTYHKALLLMNNDPHFDTGYVLLHNQKRIYSPIGMLNYANYADMDEMLTFISENSGDIQCVVSELQQLPNAVLPGQTQNPTLYDYADGINTISFLKNL